MYRIRLGTGEEAVYRTADEMALAVRSGVLSPTAEVFHKSANRWLPVEVHPDYRAVVTGKRPALPESPSGVRRSSAAHEAPPAAVTPEPADPAPTSPEPQPGPAPDPVAVVPGAGATAEEPATNPWPIQPTVASGPADRARKLRFMLAVAMGVGGIGLLGAGAFVAGPRILSGIRSVRIPNRTVEAGMDPAVDSQPAVAPVAADSTVLPAEATDPWPELQALPETPETRVSRLPAGRPAPPSYLEAYADARAEMDEAFAYVHFQQVFDAGRFASPDSLRAARRMTSAAGNILRVYRGKEVQLEQTYRPADPGGRGTLREPFEVAEESRELVSDVDSLFGLLVAQQGRFTFSDGTLRFAEPLTARRYSELRQQIISTVNRWRASPELTRSPTLPRLVRAIGTQPPPPAR